MLVRLMSAVFTPKYPLFYFGRHRRCLIRMSNGRYVEEHVPVDETA